MSRVLSCLWMGEWHRCRIRASFAWIRMKVSQDDQWLAYISIESSHREVSKGSCSAPKTKNTKFNVWPMGLRN